MDPRCATPHGFWPSETRTNFVGRTSAYLVRKGRDYVLNDSLSCACCPWSRRVALLAGCTSDQSVEQEEGDLTSLSARSRTLEFQGVVYVKVDATADEIRTAVRTQAQTAFGPLRTSNIAVNSRELKEIDTSTFVKPRVRPTPFAWSTASSTTSSRRSASGCR